MPRALYKITIYLPMGTRRDVPEQVLFDTLLFLPVISLLRFKTICKSWCSIIESSTFIIQYLYRNNKKENLIVRSYEDQLFMLSGRKYELCSNLNFEYIYLKNRVAIVNSCDGIVCFVHYISTEYWCLYLWNPSTKQVRELPVPSYLCCKYRDSLTYHMFALGFDIKTNDYKIVSVSLDWDEMLNDSIVQVYNMRTDSWRTIHKGDDFPIVWFNFGDDVACNRETCLWIGGPTVDSAAIFYFDLTDEVYGTLPLPDGHSITNHSLAFLNDKIAYIEWGCETRSCWYYEIWMMNEFGMKESWNRVYKLKESILPCEGVSRVYLSKSGEFMLTIKYNGSDYELYLYNLVTQEEALVPGVHSVGNVISYNESLVSIKSTNTTS